MKQTRIMPQMQKPNNPQEIFVFLFFSLSLLTLSFNDEICFSFVIYDNIIVILKLQIHTFYM